jgi:hypothetical protein
MVTCVKMYKWYQTSGIRPIFLRLVISHFMWNIKIRRVKSLGHILRWHSPVKILKSEWHKSTMTVTVKNVPICPSKLCVEILDIKKKSSRPSTYSCPPSGHSRHLAPKQRPPPLGNLLASTKGPFIVSDISAPRTCPLQQRRPGDWLLRDTPWKFINISRAPVEGITCVEILLIIDVCMVISIRFSDEWLAKCNQILWMAQSNSYLVACGRIEHIWSLTTW